MQKGFLTVEVSTSNQALPLLAFVTVTIEGGVELSKTTDANGQTEIFEIDAPNVDESLNPDNCSLPYAAVNVRIVCANYKTVYVNAAQIFATQTAILPVFMEPANIGPRSEGTEQSVVYDIPENKVGSPGQTIEIPPEGEEVILLDMVAIPESVIVHLGKPSASARNVTVSFSHYIKNVCCSEIYPTWPENALRANIYCQISLVLNRLFTEWYRSKGYTFDITNSTGYDQYFVPGRNIFNNISRIVDDIFNTYIRKSNFIEPFYAEYCNGTTATCPGLKQWGTVTLANQGKTPLGILRYYYGNQISLVQTDIVRGAQESYPGSPLRLGSTGANVAIIQNQLLRIRRNYPLIPTVTVDGIFGTGTQAAVKQFQKIFNLTADGVVGRSTWYKISYIFTAVKKLAELTSEGVTTPDIVSPQPSVVLRQGSTGVNVTLAQFFLNAAEDYYSQLNPVAVDGIFGSNTTTAVKQFQQFRGLTADGIIGSATWTDLYRVFYSYMNSVTQKNPSYPGTPLRVGSTGQNVGTMQRYLNVISQFFTTIKPITIDAIFGNATKAAVQEFQRLFGITQDGVIGFDTWNRVVAVYLGFVG